MPGLPSYSDDQRLLRDFLRHDVDGALLCFPQPFTSVIKPLLFSAPRHTLVCWSMQEVPKFFLELESALQQGYYAAGYLSYEFGWAFEDFGKHLHTRREPLAWFGFFDSPVCLSGDLWQQTLDEQLAQEKVWPSYWLQPLIPSQNSTVYKRNILGIQEKIAAGDTYQINYTMPLRTRLVGSESGLFLQTLAHHPVKYAALVRGSGRTLLSFSPELFFERLQAKIRVRPMKGTAVRTGNPRLDSVNRKQLRTSSKNCAENLMIVDLLRNDLGRCCRTGSVKVDRLFRIESYRSVYQMTSTISGRLRADCGWQEIFRSLYPSGSVTGAPKIRSMQIIHALESRRRGLYTGTVGWISPKRRAVFNVAIRTLEVDTQSRAAELGVGSGIVADSNAADELQETMAKANFLRPWAQDYNLIETFRWESDKGFSDLELHLARMRRSAVYFKLPWSAAAVKRCLAEKSMHLSRNVVYRVRLVMTLAGKYAVEFQPLVMTANSNLEIVISKYRVDSTNVFLQHKTSNRDLYTREWQHAQARGLVDKIFCNEKAEVTEGAITNLYVLKKNVWRTPPMACGLLPGIERGKLLAQKKLRVEEGRLSIKDLKNADEIRLSNSVRGWFTVRLKS